MRRMPGDIYKPWPARWRRKWRIWRLRASGERPAMYDWMNPESISVNLILSFFCEQQEKNWKNRRSQKLDKMEILNLQSSLQSEIQAKESIREELTQIRADFIAMQKYTVRWCQVKKFHSVLVFFSLGNCGRWNNNARNLPANWCGRTLRWKRCNNDWNPATDVSIGKRTWCCGTNGRCSRIVGLRCAIWILQARSPRCPALFSTSSHR